jgi:DNA-binding SARP family transcriptional activator
MSVDPSPQRWRCLLLTAGPGHGKTTALRSWLPSGSTRWLDPDEVIGAAQGALPSVSTTDGWLVLDDLPELSSAAALELLGWIDGLPSELRVALATRFPLPALVARWRGRGVVGHVLPADLALPAGRIAAVLRDEHDLRDPWLPSHLRAVTGGWPALVHLAAETVARLPAGAVGSGAVGSTEELLAALAEPETGVSGYIADEVLGGLPGDAVRLVLDLATFDPVSVDLARALGHDDPPLDRLTQTGITTVTDAAGRYRIVPLIAAVAAAIRPRGRLRPQARIAADWYAEHGPPLAAARAHDEAADPDGCQAMLVAHGDEILSAGGAAAFVALADALPARLRSPELRLRWGDALRIVGDVPAALAVFNELSSTMDSDPGLAWRTGMAHYLRADLQAALDAFARAVCDGGQVADEVLVHAWTSTTHWMLGDTEAATTHALRARELALLAGDDRVLAAAHIASAMARKLAGDRTGTDEHYALALRVARRAGDLAQVTRILLNQSNEQLARANYPQALELATAAVRTAETAGPAGMLVVAMCNEGEALGRSGRLDEAIERFNRVLAMCQRLGLRRAASALVGLGDVHRRRGWPEQARAAYEQAIATGRLTGELQVLVPALAGLARVRLDETPADPEATELADEAVRRATGSLLLPAWLAQGWVALAAGDRAAATKLAEQTADEARQRQEPGYLAEALELRAASEVDIDVARTALAAAHELWREAGATVDSDRVLASLGSLPDADTADRLAGALARQRQAEAGVQPPAAALALASAAGGPRWVRIHVLGRFDVRIGEQSVPATAWQSRKARDLLRILVARRARVVPREELAELLWPEDEPGRTGHRLSVLLSLVRGVLDPERSLPIDRFILADKSGIALDPTWTQVDVETFLSDVDYGGRLYEQGDVAAARSVLDAARRAYAGDPFDDEPYGDWSAPLRELARAAYLRAVRMLARLARQDGDVDQTVANLLALLERDPYDEDAHRTLVNALTSAGRHGEARRAQSRYADAMQAIGVPVP